MSSVNRWIALIQGLMEIKMNGSEKKSVLNDNVLFINNQDETFKPISTILTKNGYNVQFATSEEQSLQLIQQYTPDVILIEIKIQDINGFEIFNKLKEIEKTRDVPVIFMISQNEDKVRGYEVGAADFITIPTEPVELLTKVKMHVITSKLIRENNTLKEEIEKYKCIESPLRENEEKLKSIIASINDLVFVIDRNGVFCNFYQPLDRFDLYIPPEKFLGKSFKDVMPPHVVNMVEAAIDALNKTGNVQQIDYHLEMPDGKRLYNAKISKLIDSSKGFIGFTFVIRDITDRKKLEEILEKDQQELKLIIDSLPIIVFYKDKEGRFIRVNKTFAEALKIHEEDFVGKTVFDFYSNKIAQSMTDDDREVLNSCHSKLNIIEQYESVSGIRWAQTDKIPIRDKNDIPIGLIGFAQDITERKLAEEALKRSEEKYRELVENLNDVVFSSTADGTINYISPVVQLFSDYIPEDLIGKNFMNIVHPDDFEMIAKALIDVLQGNIFLGELRVLLKSGEVKWVHASSRPVYNGEKVIGIHGVITDISERKKAEESLKISEAKLSNAMKIANLGHWEYDVVKDIFTFNDNFYSIFHTDVKQVGGYTMSSAEYARRFVHPDDNAVVEIETKKAIETSDPYFSRYLEHRIIYANGETGYITVRFFIVKDDKGKTIMTYGVNQDITERKKTEEVLKKSLQEKDVLLLEIHHRVKNNLNIILSLLKFQEESIKDKGLKEKFNKIENRIYSIALIHSLLYKSKNISKVNFKEYITNLVNYLINSYGEQSPIIELLFNVEKTELDINKIKTLGLIINELVTNTLKYAFLKDQNKKKKIKIIFNCENDNYMLKVKDNGKGLPKNFDINKNTTSGLFLVKILCEEINGTLIIKNNRGVEVEIRFTEKNEGQTI